MAAPMRNTACTIFRRSSAGRRLLRADVEGEGPRLQSLYGSSPQGIHNLHRQAAGATPSLGSTASFRRLSSYIEKGSLEEKKEKEKEQKRRKVLAIALLKPPTFVGNEDEEIENLKELFRLLNLGDNSDDQAKMGELRIILEKKKDALATELLTEKDGQGKEKEKIEELAVVARMLYDGVMRQQRVLKLNTVCRDLARLEKCVEDKVKLLEERQGKSEESLADRGTTDLKALRDELSDSINGQSALTIISGFLSLSGVMLLYFFK